MPAHRPTIAAAKPKFGNVFDPWVAVGAGNQRAETRLPVVTGWRQSRSMRLLDQFKGGGSDTVGGEALVQCDRDRDKAQCGVVEGGPAPSEKKNQKNEGVGKEARKKGIFNGLVVYINGSTYPSVSDHKLKQVLAENGAKLSLHLGRRQVTHVILGKPSGTRGVGAGGGLAGSKLEGEIKRVGGSGVKYVGVEWVLESLRLGKRQPEAAFVTLKIAAKGQQSVYGMFKKPSNAGTAVAGQDIG